jgi:acyl dehydratase
MALNYEKLKNWPMVETVQTYTDSDTILYALGVGLGSDPVDPDQLKFVYEKGLQALPTMPTVLAAVFPWLTDSEVGIDMRKMLHGESGLTIHKPLPVAATVVGRVKIANIIDRGPEKGGALYFQHEVYNQPTDDLLATITGCFVLRGNGGFGGPTGPTPAPRAIPERAPDLIGDLKTLPQAGLIYRLTGDRNPLHADPALARSARFERPILHGSCTYGVAGHAILKLACGYDPARLKRLDVRFSAPMYPGETVRTEIWREAQGRLAFRCRVVERDVVVLNNGYAEIAS